MQNLYSNIIIHYSNIFIVLIVLSRNSIFFLFLCFFNVCLLHRLQTLLKSLFSYIGFYPLILPQNISVSKCYTKKNSLVRESSGAYGKVMHEKLLSMRGAGAPGVKEEECLRSTNICREECLPRGLCRPWLLDLTSGAGIQD